MLTKGEKKFLLRSLSLHFLCLLKFLGFDSLDRIYDACEDVEMMVEVIVQEIHGARSNVGLWKILRQRANQVKFFGRPIKPHDYFLLASDKLALRRMRPKIRKFRLRMQSE